MAQRALLHKDKVDDFTGWCEENGVATRPGKGDWELLQVNFPAGQWNKIYARANMPEHTTVQEALAPLVRAFIDGRLWTHVRQAAFAAAQHPAVTACADTSPPWE